ncbi:MAG: hypothetical protein H8K03_08175 [Nitrospira sp.]
MAELWRLFVGEGWEAMKKSPLAGLSLLIIGFLVGGVCMKWYLDDRVSSQNERMERLKIAAGMAIPSAKTPLLELTNSELKFKANRLVERIRYIVEINHKHIDSRRNEKLQGQITDEQYRNRINEENYRAWMQFETIRVEALMTSDELRERLASRIREKIETAKPHFYSADEPKAEVSPLRLLTRPFIVDAALMLAGEIEELTKLQLERLETCKC